MAVRALPHIPIPFSEPFVQLSPSKSKLSIPTLEAPISPSSTSTSPPPSPTPITGPTPSPSRNILAPNTTTTTSSSTTLPVTEAGDAQEVSTSDTKGGRNDIGHSASTETLDIAVASNTTTNSPLSTSDSDSIAEDVENREMNVGTEMDSAKVLEESRLDDSANGGRSRTWSNQERSQEDTAGQEEDYDDFDGENDDMELGHRGYLPRGMDVRDALARCEDPTLGWSLQFWVTIADPLTQHVFFACPASGQCSWDPPVGAFVVPRSPDGEWWELADATRNNRSYYYNTLTGKTQWTRPGGNAFVIPLGLIQRNALPARPKQPKRQSSAPLNINTVRFDPVTPSKPPRDRSSTMMASSSSSPLKTPTKYSYPLPPNSPTSTMSPSSSYGPNSLTLEAIVLDQFSPSPTKRSHNHHHQIIGGQPSTSTSSTGIPPSPSASHSRTVGPPTTITPRKTKMFLEDGSGNETDRSDNSGSGWWEKRKSTALVVGRNFASPKRSRVKSVYGNSGRDLESLSTEKLNGSPLKQGVTTTLPIRDDMDASSNRHVNQNAAPRLPKSIPNEPIYVDHSSVKTKRMSTGLHPLLPSDISHDIQHFQGDDFARKYFATKRSGVLRQRVPIERIMEWQKSPISAPLLVLSRSLSKDAVTTFKVIQHVMGERDRQVSDAKPMLSSSSHLNLVGLTLGGATRGGGSSGGGGELNGGSGKSAKIVVLEEIRWMIQLCVSAGEMRDEVYCQLIKQLTKNPEHDPIVLGFQLFCVLVNAFGPSKNFEPFVKSFLQRHTSEQMDGIGVMAKYCVVKLDAISAKGGRGKTLTVGEIEHASDAAFYPSVYGESLDRIMTLQQRSYPSLKVPVVLPFLADGILALGGMQSEGIFRVPGDVDSVSELKSRMDRGHYQLKGIDDPHVAASLFKLWLRELEDPIIPTKLYNDALIASRDPQECIDFVKNLPTYNRRVLLFVVSFLRLFVGREAVDQTKMTMGNLALVMAPNILRTTSNSLVTVFTNSTFESKFMMNLLEHMDPAKMDEEYVPTHGQAVGRI
ncbi:hypothetical protein CI109_105127 [Kwoniella shandongensis]|uniref:Uncharacterized protein n=1 Tax=Kwoniella shandongensis TaxID=1734106 RepID=A0A5M6C426_9TREE|nr:uncharacterized protein CI109_001966 [Kwoniella shandongensis]KAA5529541.1 hypothetical protein CI109_001966 [Kwoniella shandongensis]